MKSKLDKCPKCGSAKVASILYGLPMFNEKLERELESGEVTLGGCCITDDDPLWQCIACDHRWGKTEAPISTEEN